MPFFINICMPRGYTETTKCQHCSKEISNFAYARHVKSGICQREKKNVKRVAWNKGLTKELHPSIAKAAKKRKAHIGRYGFADPEVRKNIDYKNNGGYRSGAGRGKKYVVKDSFGKTTHLQSSFEFRCAKILDSLNIKWERPKFLCYGDKKYFPDFFLVDYDLYLDPKNSYLAKLDQQKIDRVMKENAVNVRILLDHQLNEEYIRCLIAQPV